MAHRYFTPVKMGRAGKRFHVSNMRCKLDTTRLPPRSTIKGCFNVA
jgi:hypothetical protein